ncbi:anaerobic ribonucleoside-triphosphate reductase activating protein [Acidovorax sp. FJL06]|uniref:anaerobic ribonucleoside-triphosphate reductase activating protein n=1 Tax=Acidovorax sp. FJL06 TaxID=2153365 RepID=UPI000F5830AF|nr:anaerobic ribonucleoside-triphosphate reductase activating protein [Acidovorax sp. FJL06]RQO84023.1 anaerobic ribonucleoside-triphosphate reductase activating protein [Acidovorax sp. FJL06]
MAAATTAEVPPAPALRLGGLTPLTTIDFPGRLAAVFYCQGCPWRCGYCHNPELLDATAPPGLPWERALAFLKSRRGLLDGVVFSGGEPTLQAALPAALAEVRAMGLQTALHTGGMYPGRLAALLPCLDWVGLDIKALPQHYDAITATPGSGGRAWESLEALLAHGTDHECRTTWHAGLFGVDELLALAQALAARGVRRWALQECRAPGAPAWALSEKHRGQLAALFPVFTLRRA